MPNNDRTRVEITVGLPNSSQSACSPPSSVDQGLRTSASISAPDWSTATKRRPRQVKDALHSQPELTNGRRIGRLAAQTHLANCTPVRGVKTAVPLIAKSPGPRNKGCAALESPCPTPLTIAWHVRLPRSVSVPSQWERSHRGGRAALTRFSRIRSIFPSHGSPKFLLLMLRNFVDRHRKSTDTLLVTAAE